MTRPSGAYYNEMDPFAANWLRNLITAGHLPGGEVDERDIRDVRPNELTGYTQCHFFAGIGGWPLALRSAGWPDDRPVWTGSCPCQPFSAAGRGDGFADERHLWPHWLHLIRFAQPVTIFGEQVAKGPAWAWFDLVSADLERLGFTVGAVDACAAGFGAPHWRQRLSFVAAGGVANANGLRQPRVGGERKAGTAEYGATGPLAQPDSIECQGHLSRLGQGPSTGNGAQREHAAGFRDPRQLADTFVVGRDQGRQATAPATFYRPSGDDGLSAGSSPAGPVNGFWGHADWLYCRDDKWRPVEPGSQPLVDGVPGRVGKLRGFGNAIVIPQQVEFVNAAMEILGEILG